MIENKAFEESPRWAPDGKRFLFLSTRDGNQEVYRADADGTNVRRLTSEVAADNNPGWSPDGKAWRSPAAAPATSRSGPCPPTAAT